MKKFSKSVSALLVVIMCFCFVACGEEEKKSAGYSGMVDGVTFTLQNLGDNVNLHTELQNEYFSELAESE